MANENKFLASHKSPSLINFHQSFVLLLEFGSEWILIPSPLIVLSISCTKQQWTDSPYGPIANSSFLWCPCWECKLLYKVSETSIEILVESEAFWWFHRVPAVKDLYLPQIMLIEQHQSHNLSQRDEVGSATWNESPSHVTIHKDPSLFISV